METSALRLVVDWVHIREAERRGRTVTPFGLALLEQTRFCAGQITPEAILLTDAFSGETERLAPHPALLAYLQRFRASQAVEPAEFVLEAVA
jgi:hypothetical protein